VHVVHRSLDVKVLSASRDETMGERVPVEKIGLSQVRFHANRLRELAGGPIEEDAMVRHIARRFGYGRTSAQLRDKIELALRTDGPAEDRPSSNAGKTFRRSASPVKADGPELAKAERRVLTMMAEHVPHHEITRKLALDPKASRRIQGKLARLLGVANERREIVAAARNRGWL
jgi:hypothetical protein